MKKHLWAFLTATLLVSAYSHQAFANDWGFRFQPLTALLGLINVSVDIGVSPNIVVSPEFATWSATVLDEKWALTGYGVAGFYNFSGNFNDSWYLGGRLFNSNFEASNSTSKASASVMMYGLVAGYTWQWTNFYMNLGGILGASNETKLTLKDTTTGLTTSEVSIPSSAGAVGLDWKLGWSF